MKKICEGAIKKCRENFRRRREEKIAQESKDDNGFECKLVFYNQEFKKTNVEMIMEEKNKVSYRGKMLRKTKESETRFL